MPHLLPCTALKSIKGVQNITFFFLCVNWSAFHSRTSVSQETKTWQLKINTGPYETQHKIWLSSVHQKCLMIILVPKLFQKKMHSCHIYMCVCILMTWMYIVPFTALSPIPLQQYIYRYTINSQAYMVMFGRLIFWFKNGWLTFAQCVW